MIHGPYNVKLKVKALFYPTLPDFPNSTACWKVSMEHWFNENGRDKPQHSATNLSHCQSALHGERPATNRLHYSTACCKDARSVRSQFAQFVSVKKTTVFT